MQIQKPALDPQTVKAIETALSKGYRVDAYDRAREAGNPMEYDEVARRIIYGY